MWFCFELVAPCAITLSVGGAGGVALFELVPPLLNNIVQSNINLEGRAQVALFELMATNHCHLLRNTWGVAKVGNVWEEW